MIASIRPYTLDFITPGGTSRGVLKTKDTFILTLQSEKGVGLGECALFRGLSMEDTPLYEEKLQWLLKNINLPPGEIENELRAFPSILIGYEQAMLNLRFGKDLYFPSDFTEGKDSLVINGLIWMGDKAYMESQIQQKLEAGYKTLKLKIGTHWEEEKTILTSLRQTFSAKDLELRVDANGAFTYEQALKVLDELAELEIHSIEQPIKANQKDLMERLAKATPTPIALDEELIGVVQPEDKKDLLEKIKPQYIILKPSLLGGFKATDEWISLAENVGIGWWITSALESNLGLNAIAQYTYTKNPTLPQGLGTGSLYQNNLDSSLILEGENLRKKVS
ncbi:o-succinylbenzoate synthase [Chryseobacterium sp. A301]